MSRKIRRTPDFEINLEIKNDRFIAPPRASQHNSLLNKAVAEFADDLNQLHHLAARFVPGQESIQLQERTHTDLANDEIMDDWQIPLMRAMAGAATKSHGDLLEIGFGRGISAGMIQELGVRSHTIAECDESEIYRYYKWLEDCPDKDIRLIKSRWRDVTDQFTVYNTIFFHTYLFNEDDYNDQVADSTTFAEHLFPTAARYLREVVFLLI
jgi:guanidinoacetate N-methyltransferase